MKTLGGSADAFRLTDAYRVVWLLEVDADEPDAATVTQRYAHRAYSLEGNAYSDAWSAWPTFGWARLRPEGGFAQVAKMKVQLRNEAKVSHLSDTYFLENDEVRAYLIFVSGSEDLGDRVEMFRGVIEDVPFEQRNWTLDIIDGTDKDFREIPQDRINLIDYVDAPLDALGKVVPVAFGNLNVGPHDGAGASARLAPCRGTNLFTQEYTSGLFNATYGGVFQYYGNAKRYASVSNITQTGGVFTVDTAVRTLRLGGVLSASSNDVAGYKATMDGDVSNGVTIASSDNLDILIGGTPQLGSLTQLDLVIDATGPYTYTLLLDGSSKASDSATDDVTINVSTGPADHADRWNFELYEVRIDGTAAATINDIYLLLTYDDRQTLDRTQLELFQAVTGFKDLTANYADGSAIASGGALTNSVDQLEAILRGKKLMGMTEAQVNLPSFATAVTARSGWNASFVLDTPASMGWLNELCFQFGLHLFKDYEGKWKVVARDKSAAPAHTFLGNYNLAVRSPTDDPSAFELDIKYSRTSMRDLINEIALRYNYDPATDNYGSVEIVSGRARVTGTCSVNEVTSQLTDASATFQADGVKLNDTVYVQGDKDYLVTVAPSSETVLAITAKEGGLAVRPSAAGTTYHVGPNLDGAMLRSQQRYKTENPLGQAQDAYSGIGGYLSKLITDSTTATNVVDHLKEWRSQRRLEVEFSTFLNFADGELGDLAWFDHDWLPDSKRPISLGTITGAINASVTALASAENRTLRAEDFLLLDNEVVKVASVNFATTAVTITRAQHNTVAASHAAGTTIKRLNLVRWEVVGIKPDPVRQQFRVRLQETPPGYFQTGIVVAADSPEWSEATQIERHSSGWCSLLSGRVLDEDENSAISYCGPDTGVH